METPTLEQITELQKQYGLDVWQRRINSGSCWTMEGWYGRRAMELIECGACMLSEERQTDYYGSLIPSRNDVKDGTKGSLGNSQAFWQKVIDGEIMLVDEESEDEEMQ
jgi:hypothetical protein